MHQLATSALLNSYAILTDAVRHVDDSEAITVRLECFEQLFKHVLTPRLVMLCEMIEVVQESAKAEKWYW